MSTLLLSDLHLPAEPSPLREGFLSFLSGPARSARRVYILGDLFEVWIGDDAGLRDYGPEIEALAALVRYGVPVHFQHGNRDFLVGRRFAEATGVRLLADPMVLDLEGIPTLLSHGDRYCTDDQGYQRWRRVARNPLVQWLYLRLPDNKRRGIAERIRGQSRKHGRYKPEEIMDVNREAIARAFSESRVGRLIHGHTHRPAEHQLQVDGRDCQRVVLADWRPGRMEYLKADRSGLHRILV